MDNLKYCVYNQTRESFLSLGVTVPNATGASLRGLIESITTQGDKGLWMMPYKGIPPAHGLAPIDLVYLDHELKVIQEVESYPTATQESWREEAASALVLPTHTIYSSQTQQGDQLLICEADEMEQRLERLSNSNVSSSSRTVISSIEKRADAQTTESTLLARSSADNAIEVQGSDGMNNFEQKSGKPNSLRAWLQNWLSSDRRRAHRLALPGLVAYYWTGSAPRAYQIADISSTGFYLLTEERWFPGTIVLMTLQRTDGGGQNLDDSIAVQSRVVRWGSDGLGLAFVLSRSSESRDGESLREHGADKKTLEKFLSRVRESA